MIRAMSFGIIAAVVAGVAIAVWWLFNKSSDRGGSPANVTLITRLHKNQNSGEPDAKEDSTLPRLPETSPPPGLPIIPWGKRDHFPVIRNPEYWSADEGDNGLTRDEPVLGLVINGESRAYSTNQLNDHEMVVDTIAGRPVLVTY